MGASPISTTMKNRHYRHRPRIWSKAELVRRVIRLRWCLQLVRHVLLVFPERPYLRADVAVQDHLAVLRYGEDKVRQLKARSFRR